jgi:hypothetical protein
MRSLPILNKEKTQIANAGRNKPNLTVSQVMT